MQVREREPGLAFLPDASEEAAAWVAHAAAHERAVFLLANALIVALVPAWGLVDRLLVPQLSRTFLHWRLAGTVVAALAVGGLLLSRQLRLNRLIMLASLVTVGGIVALMVPKVGAAQGSYVFGLSLVIWGAGMLLPWPLRWSIAGWIVSIAAFVVAHYAQYGSFHGQGFAGAVFYLGSAAIIASVNAEYRWRLQARAFRASRELSRSNARLKELSDTDELTGLRNYRRFLRDLEAEFKRFQRTGQPASLLMLDVDHFKHFNDRNGHEAGNRVLRELAALFRHTLREIDAVARYGGEELCAIVVAPADRALAIASRVQEAVAGHAFEGREGQPGGILSVSIGVSAFEKDDTSERDVIARADAALYRCKQQGRNLVKAA